MDLNTDYLESLVDSEDEKNKWDYLKHDVKDSVKYSLPKKEIRIIEWNGWNMVVFETPADGHCLFHSICGSFFIDYKEASIKEKVRMVKTFRKELSELLPFHYEKLHGGNILSFSEHVEEYKLSNMKNTLNSDHMVGYGYLQFICDVIEKDILIFDEMKMDVYFSDEVTVNDRNRVIVLCYDEKGFHYETLGIRDNDKMITHFEKNHPFILELKKRMKNDVS